MWYEDHRGVEGSFQDYVRIYCNDIKKVQRAIRLIDEILHEDENLADWRSKLSNKSIADIEKFEFGFLFYCYQNMPKSFEFLSSFKVQ